MKENNNDEKFSGQCKEKNHQNLELSFYCKNHNELCCEKCLSKEKDKGQGPHHNCKVCSLEKIKAEKENILKENIKNLETYLNPFKESIKDLEKVIEKSNEEKENIKVKIQKLFTRIRNALNKREDELYLQVDKIYEIYENVNVKACEKSFKMAKTSLEKGKKLENEWNNNNNLIYLINDCLNIEKNITNFKIMGETMNKTLEENKNVKDFFPNIDMDKLIQSINTIGIVENIKDYKESEFNQIDGQLMQISSGTYGVWGVNKNYLIYYRKGISPNSKGGNIWIQVDGLLKYISSGESGVWGVNFNNEIFYRKGITKSCPEGTSWGKIDGELKQISSGEYGAYGVNSIDKIWFRGGITKTNPLGNRWFSIEGRLKNISVGSFGVWGVNHLNEVFLRKNVTRENPVGDGWIKIEGNFKQISSGEKFVLAVNENNEIFYRKGISIYCIEGQSWEKYKESLSYISDGAFGIWGLDNDGNIFYN